MQEAFGGLLNVFLLALFLTIVSGVLAVSVNYIKAFRMKNFVISTIEKYEGTSCLINQSSACAEEIVSNANKIGYGGSSMSCPHGYSRDYSGLYCYKANYHSKGRYSYSIITQVSFNFPVIDKILNFDIFQVHGDTRIIETPKKESDD